MGKMKTAAELAMERTRHMVSGQRDGTQDFEGYIKAARSLLRSLTEGKTTPEKIKEAFERYPGEAREQARKAVFADAASQLNMENTPALIKTIKLLSGDRAVEDACGEMEKLHARYQDKLAHALKEMEKNAETFWRKKLAAEGIRGSAVYRYLSSAQDEPVRAQIEEEYKNLLGGFRSLLVKS